MEHVERFQEKGRFLGKIPLFHMSAQNVQEYELCPENNYQLITIAFIEVYGVLLYIIYRIYRTYRIRL